MAESNQKISPTPEYRMKMAEVVGKGMAFPGVDTFGELFEEWTICHGSLGRVYPRIDMVFCEGVHGEQRGWIGDHVQTHRAARLNEWSLRAKPKQFVVSWIFENMIIVDHDTIYFKLTERADGVLVSASNNTILSSHWLALLDHDYNTEIVRNARVRDEFL